MPHLSKEAQSKLNTEPEPVSDAAMNEEEIVSH